MLADTSKDFQEVKRRVHKGSTRNFGYPQLIDTNARKIAVKRYGCIVFMGDGDGDTIGEIIGDGDITGCAATMLGGAGDGDIDAIGDVMGDADGIG